jgi:tape measure domain-containing protein
MSGIKVELELDSGDFEAGLVRATTKLSDLQNQTTGTITSITRISGESKNFLSTLRDVTVILGQAHSAMELLHRASTGWIGDIVRMNAEVERMTALLKAMSTATDPVKEAADYIKNLREEAKQAPFSLQAMHQAFIRMKAGGLDPAAGSMKALTDAVAAFGGTDETLGRASLAFQEMAGKGVVQMKELRNQLGMAVPQAMQMLARSVGVTYQELMADVHTGTLNAKTAIEALNLEFERVYGGAAVRQMDTFNGQLNRMKVIMMDLAIKAGGVETAADGAMNEKKGGFFNTIKSQFKEMNDNMSGLFGQKLAEQVGQALTSIAVSVHSGIETMIQFRGVIVSAAEALAIGFGANLAIKGVAGLIAMLTAAREAVALFRAQWVIMTGAMAAANTGAAAWTALGTLVPMLGPIGLGLGAIAGGFYLLADRLHLFKDEAKDAFKEISRFGATSKDKLELADKYVTREEGDLARRKQFNNYGQSPESLKDEESRVAGLRRQQNQNRAEYLGEAARQVSTKILTQYDEEVAALRRKYAAQKTIEDKAYTDQFRALTNAGHSTTLIRQEFQNRFKKEAIEFYDDLIAYYERKEKELKEKVQNGSEVDKAIAQKTIDELHKKIDEEKKAREKEAGFNMNDILDTKPMNDQRLWDKGVSFLNKLNADIEGAKAGLQGLDPEVYALADALKNAKFGDELIPRVQELAKQILQAKQDGDDLNKILTGQQHLDRDLLNNEISLRQKLIDIQTEGMSDTDKLRVKIQSGFYDGFGNANSPLQQRLIDMRAKMGEVGTESQKVGDIFKNSTFGAAATSAAQGFLDIVTKIAGAFVQLKDGATSTNLSNAFSTASTGSMPIFSVGQQQTMVSGSYYDKLFHRESNGDASAASSSSSAVGLGQFIEKTWLQFIKEEHTDLMGLGKETVLNLRKDPNLNKQATAWYANKNAADLSSYGIDPTDANVYASHFLGPGGARALLSAPDNQMVSSIRALAAAVESNPTILAGKTVGQVRGSLNSQFGTGYTWAQGFTGGPGVAPRYDDDSKLGRPANISDKTNSQLEGGDRLEQAINEAKGEKNIKEKAKELKELIEQAALVEEGNNKRLGALRKLIQDGKLDSSDKDPDSARYTKLIGLVKDLDVAEKKRDDAKKARTAASGARESLTQMRTAGQDALEMARANALGDPEDFKYSQEYQRNEKTLRMNRDKIKASPGTPEEDAKAEEDAAAEKQVLLDKEVYNFVAGLNKKTTELKRSLMDQNEAREDEFQKDVRRIQSNLAQFKGSEEDKAKLVAISQKYINAQADVKANQSPMGKQFKEWSDLAGNFEKQLTSSMSGAVDTIAGALVGIKANWKNVLQSLAKDLLKLVLQWSLATAGMPAKGQVRGAAAGAKASGGAKTGGLSSLFSTAHTGGIIGGALSYRSLPASIFANAPRFHSGGIVGVDEVPIVARKGEGVFTPEQMNAIGGLGGQNVHVSMPITVHGSGGSHADNQELARTVGRHVEGVARTMVVEELRKQMRPGNLLSTQYARG